MHKPGPPMPIRTETPHEPARIHSGATGCRSRPRRVGRAGGRRDSGAPIGWTGSDIYRRLILEPNANLYSVLAAGFPADRQGVAIQTPERTYSWEDIDRCSARMANLLCTLAEPGSRVAVQ